MTEPRQGSWSSAPADAPTTELVLLRHGETPLTPERRFSGIGSGDPGLSPVGQEQARRAAAAVHPREGGFDLVLSSPLRRCRETAEIVATALGLPVELDADLREADFGAWEGLTFAEVAERHPEDLAAWQRSTAVAPTGSSETFDDVGDRVAGLVDRVRARSAGQAVLAVSHVTPMKAFVAHALGAPASSFFAMELSSAAVCRVSYTGPDRLLRSFNETAHLRDV